MSNVKTTDIKTQNNSNLRYRTYSFSLKIIDFVKTLPNTRIYWVIVDQLLRSSTSIGANIFEAKSSSSRKDFINYYHISLKSAHESKYWICLLRDSKLVESISLEILINEVDEIIKMLSSSLLTLKKIVISF